MIDTKLLGFSVEHFVPKPLTDSSFALLDMSPDIFVWQYVFHKSTTKMIDTRTSNPRHCCWGGLITRGAQAVVPAVVHIMHTRHTLPLALRATAPNDIWVP